MAEFQMRPVECPVRLDGLSPVEVAGQLRQMSELVGTERFTVVEMGAGRGFLCRDILEWARANAPARIPARRIWMNCGEISTASSTAG